MQSSFEANFQGILGRIGAAAERSGRDVDDIKLVAVSKTHSVTTLRQALSAGISVFGENKVQEAETKIEELGRDSAEWRLIGHLQSNKARKAVQLFDVVESLDSIELAKRLERICIEDGRSELPVLVEVDLAGETSKSGIPETQLAELVRILEHCVCLRFDGLMVLPPYSDDAEGSRPYFQKLRTIRDELQEKGAFKYGTGELSMGMSHDFEIAIEEGATIVRIGTAIFGSRTA
jgi:pyridoxal phosphate enzyme (YggS family)